MKKLLFLLICLNLFSSCSQEDILSSENESINDELVTNEIETKSVQNTSGYEGSVPVWQYYTYGSSTEADHYFTSTEQPIPDVKGATRRIKNTNYEYCYHDFNVLKNNDAGGLTIPLYRYYSPSGKRHRLSTIKDLKSDDYYKDYTYDGVVGYIFKRQLAGTLALYEQMSINQKEFNYNSLYKAIRWGEINMPGDIKDLGIIGYVYPGKRCEVNGKIAPYVDLTFEDPTGMRGLHNRPIVKVTIRVREQIKPGHPIAEKEFTYKENFGFVPRIQLAGVHSIEKIYVTITLKDSKNILRNEIVLLYPHPKQKNGYWYTGGTYVTFQIGQNNAPNTFSYTIMPYSGYSNNY